LHHYLFQSTFVQIVAGMMRDIDSKDLKPVKLHGHIAHEHSKLMTFIPMKLHGHMYAL